MNVNPLEVDQTYFMYVCNVYMHILHVFVGHVYIFCIAWTWTEYGMKNARSV